MPTIGSSTAPSFAGWQWVGSSNQSFASQWVSPAFDIYIYHLHAYFNTFAGSGAHGYLVVWAGDDRGVSDQQIAISSPFIINNGSKSAGGQQWWDQPITPVFIPASTQVWIGGHSDQGIIWSTYDSSLATYTKATGITPSTSFFNSPTNTGQGPCGAYGDYSKIIYAPSANLGAKGGGIVASGSSGAPSGVTDLGQNGGGIKPFTPIVRSAGTATLGGAGTGIAPVTTFTKMPKIWVWRP